MDEGPARSKPGVGEYARVGVEEGSEMDGGDRSRE